MSDVRITITELVDALSVESTPTSITVFDGVFVDSGSGGGGDVASVNGQTGVVVLAASDVGAQPVDTDLTAIAALATTTFGRSLLTAADAAAARVLTGAGTSSLALGTTSSTAKAGDYQPAAANISDATAIGKTVLTAANAAAVRTAIGAGTSSFDGAYASLTGKPTLGTAAAAATTDFDAAGAAAAAQAASQPLDSDLTAIAALTTTTFGRSLLTAADAAAVRTAIGAGTSSLALGTSSSTAKAGDYQPASTNISDATTVGKAVLTGADAAAVRTTLGLGTAATISATAGGDLSGTLPSPTVAKINGTSLAGLATGLLKNTTGTGVPSIAVAADIPNIAESQVTNLVTDLAAKAPLASPAFTGHPTGVTETAGDNSTRLATTAYTDAAVAAGGGGGGGGSTLDPFLLIGA